MLITGGLVIVGLVALVSAFFLARTDENVQPARRTILQEQTITQDPALIAPQEGTIANTIVREEMDSAILGERLQSLQQQANSLLQQLQILGNVAVQESGGAEESRLTDTIVSIPANEIR